MNKCKNCKWQSCWFWDIFYLFAVWYGNMSNYGKFCVYPNFRLYCDCGNKDNDCKYYKRKWYLFWVGN